MKESSTFFEIYLEMSKKCSFSLHLKFMNPPYEYFQLVARKSLYSICAKIVMLLQKGFEPILGLVAPPPARASIHTLMNKYPIFWKSTTLGCIEV